GVDFFERGNLGAGEADRAIGRPGDDRKTADGTVKGQRQIVGSASRSDLRKQRVFRRVLDEPAPERHAALDRRADRAAQIFVRLLTAAQDPILLDYLELAQPANAEPADLRMQGLHVERRAPQW